MRGSELSDAAWDLVEHCRVALSGPERHTAFVLLGVGDYAEAIEIALQSVVGTEALPIPGELLDRLARLQQTHYFDRGIAELLATVSAADEA